MLSSLGSWKNMNSCMLLANQFRICVCNRWRVSMMFMTFMVKNDLKIKKKHIVKELLEFFFQCWRVVSCNNMSLSIQIQNLSWVTYQRSPNLRVLDKLNSEVHDYFSKCLCCMNKKGVYIILLYYQMSSFFSSYNNTTLVFIYTKYRLG